MTPLQHGRKGRSALHAAAMWFRRARAPVQRLARQLHSTVRPALKRLGRPLQIVARYMPKGLYPRALVIVIAPVVLLQSVIAYVFMERHWQTVTQRLSSAVSADIAMLIDVYESYPQDADTTTLSRIAAERLGMDLDIIPDSDLPAPGPRPFFSLLDNALSTELSQQVARPFWLDTGTRADREERVDLPRTPEQRGAR